MEEALKEALWRRGAEERGQDIGKEVEWLRGTMQHACDASMPRTKSCSRRAVYWWTDEIAELRRESTRARRRLKWLRPRGDPNRIEEALAMHRAAKRALCIAIKKSRASCWDEMLHSLNTDPWGCPYKIVTNKYRQWALPATESLEPHILNRVVSTLFPVEEEGDSLNWGPETEGPLELEEDVLVSEEEIQAVRKMGSNKAPGPDGVPGRIWVRGPWAS